MVFITGIIFSRLKVSTLFNKNNILLRQFGTSSNRKGLSDPFRPKKEDSNRDIRQFLNDKKASKGPDSDKIQVNEENVLGRIFKRILNPTPLNLKLRKTCNLNENYRLVYIIENERLFIIIHSLINTIFPVFFGFVLIFLIAELTDRSQMSKSFENPYLFVSILSLWFSFTYFLAKRVQSTNVFRVYYNQKEEKYASIRLKGVFKFEKEDFAKDAFKLRLNETDAKSTIVKNLTRNFGNVYINNKLRQIDFKLFSSNEIVEKLLDKKSFDYLKSKSLV